MTVVAIDGPAAAGKSTVARGVARALGFRYVDTGALYRAVTLAALERGVEADDGAALAALATKLDIELEEEHVSIDGGDATARIRSPEVTEAVSAVAAQGAVREALLKRQRALAAGGDVVIEGRDIGAAVVPDAEVKVFLTASLTERASRRARQLGLPEDEQTLERLRRAVARRDDADAGRDVSPFVKPPGALVIDSTGKDVPAIITEIVTAVRDATHGN
jgi:cytidylate kinase